MEQLQRRDWDAELKGALQYLFITIEKYSISRTARELGMRYDDLYQYIAGRRTMPHELLRKIVDITGEKMFLDVTWAGSKVQWRWRAGTHPHTDNVVAETLEVNAALGEYSDRLREALRDGHINSKEKLALRTAAAETIRQLEDILDILTTMDAKSPATTPKMELKVSAEGQQ